MTRTELVMGLHLRLTLFALVQSLVILLFVFVFALRVHYSGNLALVFLVLKALLTIGSVNLAFPFNLCPERVQIVQFIPLVFGIQVFLIGFLAPSARITPKKQPYAKDQGNDCTIWNSFWAKVKGNAQVDACRLVKTAETEDKWPDATVLVYS